MPGHNYKTPGLIRAGFQYQDLVAIEILIDFYRDRSIYQWVKLDAEDDDFRSIEDVVSCTPDGLYDLFQVKFTADPDASTNNLSWEWLTQRRGKAKSLLQKWALTTLRHRAAGTLRRAVLKTDRIPDDAIGKCLIDKKINYGAIASDTRNTIEKQLGSESTARDFFEVFEFEHSYPRLDDLEERLWSRLSSDTDRGGWALFCREVQRWSTLKNNPSPDGRIRYIHLSQAFSVERPKPMPQDFVVPSTYSVPNKSFDTDFLTNIATGSGTTVLWGPPGRGKSTYLSHCVERISPKVAICIRHHYFLSLDDRSEGRFSFQAIARSLEHQLREALPDLVIPNGGDGIKVAAEQLAKEERRLIIIIDGLDHVWREHRDHEHMEELFNMLLPLPPNVRLVVGTQKVASEHLPARLLNALPFDRWTELPLMSPAAVHHWVDLQDKAGRLNLETTSHQPRRKTVIALAHAFHDISQGLPLHLIYSFEALTRSGAPITVDDVTALPPCPSGDIRDYYRMLWERLTPRARAILHVLAGLEFGPPPFAMGQCFGLSNDDLSAAASINYLLDYREAEIRPFHGSLFGFVKEVPEHQTQFRTNAPAIQAWLETAAPDYWRWAWLWITKAQLGDTVDLVSKPDRQWAIEALVNGYPIEQLVTILNHAEILAFDVFDFSRTLELRSLKMCALNGPEFQVHESWPLFPEVAISLSQNADTAAVLRSNVSKAPAGLLPFIVRCTSQTARKQVAKYAVDELNHRITIRRGSQVYNQDWNILSRAIARVVTHLGPQSAERLVKFAERTGVTDDLISLYMRESILTQNFDNVLAAGKLWSGREADRDVLTVLCLEGLSPSAHPGLKSLGHPAIRCLALLKGEIPKRSRTKRNISHLFVGGEGPSARFNEATHGVLYDCFFASFARGVSKGKATSWVDIPDTAEGTWLAGAVRALEDLAQDIATGWRLTGNLPNIREIYQKFVFERSHDPSHDMHRRFVAVRLAFRDIAIDLSLLRRALDASATIDASDILAVHASPYWLDELWLDAFSNRRIRLHTPTAVEAFTERRGQYLDRTVTQFDERAEEAIKLALLALDHGVIHRARQELSRAVGCLLGYGYRKDMFAFEVLESLRLLARIDCETAKEQILNLSGAFETITLYTDGDETDHARLEYYELLAKHFPERAPTCYAQLVRAEEWRYAESLCMAFAESTSLETVAGQRLLETFISPKERHALDILKLEERPRVSAAKNALVVKLGLTQAEATRPLDGAQADSALQVDGKNGYHLECQPSPEQYPPGQLEIFLKSIRDLQRIDCRHLVSVWLTYWETLGRSEAALADFEAVTSKPRARFDTEAALDTAFEVSCRTQGRTKALTWLARAHAIHYGWHQWHSKREEAEARLRTAAQLYRDRWQEFVVASSAPVFFRRDNTTTFVIGISRLIYFLLEVGEMNLARTYALAIVRIFKEELSEQPIIMPEWSR